MVTDNPILPRMVPSPSKPCETCRGSGRIFIAPLGDMNGRDTPCPSCQPKSESLKCCDKAFVWSGGEGTSHMCCNVHCCKPLVASGPVTITKDFEPGEIIPVPTPPKESVEMIECPSSKNAHMSNVTCSYCEPKTESSTHSRAEGWEADFTSRFDHHGWMLKPEVIRAVIEYFKPRLLSSRHSAIEECIKVVENTDEKYKTTGKAAISLAKRQFKKEAIAALRLLREESEDKKGV